MIGCSCAAFTSNADSLQLKDTENRSSASVKCCSSCQGLFGETVLDSLSDSEGYVWAQLLMEALASMWTLSVAAKAVNTAHQDLSSALQSSSLFCIPGHSIHKPFSSDQDDLSQAASKCEQDFMQQGWSPSLANRSNCWHLHKGGWEVFAVPLLLLLLNAASVHSALLG